MSLNYNNPRKNPPAFSSLKSYEQWKKEVTAWTRLTTENEKEDNNEIICSIYNLKK